ncbi:MAG TPA: multidrug DMT transporter permease [Falsiroseomonas sp.]|jgi:hypothetical protein|nr:multidrug DMT transporter permease [Falsiroseomonas sp.]
MSAALLATLLLSVSAFIHTRSADPRMRPENAYADLFWRGLAFTALVVWGALIARIFYTTHWANGLAALFGSFALNWYFAFRGPRPAWPGLSMLFGVVGLGLAAWSFMNE